MEIFPDKRKLVGVVEQAYEGKLCLPEFQRDFVWPRDGVADLLRSVLRGYYIGSLLLLRCDPQNPPFAPAFLRGTNPKLRRPEPDRLVLDGQQRLTAMLYALTAPDLVLKDTSHRRWFFLDLRLLLEDIFNDGVVFDCAESELDGLNREEVQFQRRVLPFTFLLRPKDFLAWRDHLDDWLEENEPANHKSFRQTWRDVWTTAANDFQSFEAPVVELPPVEDSKSDGIGRVCAIFEKLNSTGVELSVYDLLGARLYRNKIRLRSLWTQACQANARLAEWSKGKADTNKFGVLILRTLALLRGLDPKARILIDLAPEGFERDWYRPAQAIEQALALLTLVGPDGLGVFDRKWLPGFGLIPVLAALRAGIEERSLGEEARADLRRWYWSNVFLERYSSAVESKSRKDYADLMGRWSGEPEEPAVFVEARARIGTEGYTIRDTASHASAIYSGVFCLLGLRGARDWGRGENIQLQALNDHHIFPQAFLKRHGVNQKKQMNSIANRTLISDATNNRIKDCAPAAYLQESSVFPNGPMADILAPHFLPPLAMKSMREATEDANSEAVKQIYEQFLQARERAIVEEIRRVCGLSTEEPRVCPPSIG